MLRKDYFVRQLEEFGKVLGVLLFLKKQNDWDKFTEELAKATPKFTSFELEFVEKLNDSEFLSEIIENEKVNLEQKTILANILFEKMDFYAHTVQTDKENETARKCLALYEFLHNNQSQNEFNLQTHYRLQFLKSMGL